MHLWLEEGIILIGYLALKSNLLNQVMISPME